MNLIDKNVIKKAALYNLDTYNRFMSLSGHSDTLQLKGICPLKKIVNNEDFRFYTNNDDDTEKVISQKETRRCIIIHTYQNDTFFYPDIHYDIDKILNELNNRSSR